MWRRCESESIGGERPRVREPWPEVPEPSVPRNRATAVRNTSWAEIRVRNSAIAEAFAMGSESAGLDASGIRAATGGDPESRSSLSTALRESRIPTKLFTFV